jgi:hypothetical protein
MFRKLPDGSGPRLTVFVEGQPVAVSEGDSAATAALLAGLSATRASAIGGQPRAPYCMMGVCFECLMVIDGLASQQACLVTVREGMRIARQPSRPAIAKP